MTAAVIREVGRGEAGGTSQCGVVPLSPEEVGQRILEARLERRWSRLDLATAFDVSPSSVYRWENGKLPSVSVLLALSRMLGKPDDYLTEPPERRVEMDDLRGALATILARLDELEASVEERGQIVADALDRTTTLLERLVAQARLDSAQAKVNES